MTDAIRDKLAEALREALVIVGDHSASCEGLHHGPNDRHEPHMECPVEKRIRAGEVRIREALRAYDAARGGDGELPNVVKESREARADDELSWFSYDDPPYMGEDISGISGASFHPRPGMGLKMNKPVLDVCCGSRMFWFNREDERAHFNDKRREMHMLKDSSSAGGLRELIIDPDTTMDFTDLKFDCDTFHLVVFDPPHLLGNGATGWLAKKYGSLLPTWQEDIRAGFIECFRVLKPNGTLIFKWNEENIPVSQILALTPARPLFGNRCGKTAKSHWIVFMKTENP